MANHYSYLKFFRGLYQSQELKYRFTARTKEEFYLWKQKFREELSETLGLNLLESIHADSGLKDRFLNQIRPEEETQEEGYLRRRYVMETLPEVSMPFYMLIPDGIEKGERRPAVIAVPAHGANKDTVAGVPLLCGSD